MDQEEMNAVKRAKRNLARENAAKKERKKAEGSTRFH